MDARRNTPVETPPGLGWARRVLLQQLDALSRLAAAAWRLVEPATPAAEPLPATAVTAGILGLEKALRLQARVTWALRLIDALRARLVVDLQALDNGQAPTPTVEARSFAAEPETPTANAARGLTDRVESPENPERPERLERLERLERERFGFESRYAGDDLAEILKRPTAEVIALICRELGLPADWPQLAEAAWAREEADDGGAVPPLAPAPRSSPSLSWITAAPS